MKLIGLSLSAAILLTAFVDRTASLDINVPVEHSLGGAFTSAGSLQGSLLELVDTKGEQLTLFRKDLKTHEQEALAELVRQNKDYRLRVAADPRSPNGPMLQTSIPARCLAAASFEDHLQLHVTGSGKLVGLNYDFAKHPCDRSTEVTLSGDLNFAESSPVPVWLPTVGPTLRKREPVLGEEELVGKPTGKARQAKGGKGGSDSKETPAEDTRPWLLKNWMIALPIAFIAVNVLGQFLGPMDLPQQGGAAPPAAVAPRRR